MQLHKSHNMMSRVPTEGDILGQLFLLQTHEVAGTTTSRRKGETSVSYILGEQAANYAIVDYVNPMNFQRTC